MRIFPRSRYAPTGKLFAAWLQRELNCGRRLGKSPLTHESYRQSCSLFALANWNELSLSNWLDAMQKAGYAWNTQRKHMKQARRWWKVYLRDKGYMGDPLDWDPMPYMHTLRPTWSIECIQRIVNHCEPFGGKSAIWWQSLFMFAYASGLRTGELLELRFDQIRGRILTRDPKHTKKGQRGQILLSAYAMRCMANFETERAPDIDGKWSAKVLQWNHHKRHLYTGIVKHVRAAGLEIHGLHAARRGLATDLACTQSELATVALGHTTTSTTVTHYVAQHAVADAVDKLTSRNEVKA